MQDALWQDIHILTGIYCLLVSDRMKFSGFLITKTSVNKRFIMSANVRYALQNYIFFE
jgi:hypothetical protein